MLQRSGVKDVMKWDIGLTNAPTNQPITTVLRE